MASFSRTSSSVSSDCPLLFFLFQAMRSHSLSLCFHRYYRRHHPPSSPIAILQSHRIFSDPARYRCSIDCSFPNSFHGLQLNASNFHAYGFKFRRSAFDQDFDIPSLDDYDWGENAATAGYILSSSDSEDSDVESILNPISDTDLPAASVSTNDALSASTHRLAMLGRGSRKHKIRHGVFINIGLILFLMALLSYVDWCAWRIVRLPLDPFHLTRPFIISTILASFAGYICVPLFHSLNFYQIIRKGPARHYLQIKTPTLGGLFFVPVGLTVAQFLVGFSSSEVSGAVGATLAFAAIGLLDDILSLIKNHSYGLSPWVKILLEVATGIWFSFWLNATTISTPYSMKMLVPLPPPLGLVYIGKYYSLLTSICFVSMGNGVKLTDGLDGLAGGTSALALIGMAIAVLPISSDLAVFGASMAGACVGFLLHNRYKASVFMGDTGSFALGGALAAMAASSGMFFPLLISSAIFLVEPSFIIQVLYMKTTKHYEGRGPGLFGMIPFHHKLELRGIKKSFIVVGAYVISSVLVLLAGYIGLISA